MSPRTNTLLLSYPPTLKKDNSKQRGTFEPSNQETPITKFRVPQPDPSSAMQIQPPKTLKKKQSLYDSENSKSPLPNKRRVRRSGSDLRRNSSRESKEEGSFFEQKDESFMSNNSVRSRNRMRQRSQSRKSRSKRESSVKLNFTPSKSGRKPKVHGSKRKSPFGSQKPPVKGKQGKSRSTNRRANDGHMEGYGDGEQRLGKFEERSERRTETHDFRLHEKSPRRNPEHGSTQQPSTDESRFTGHGLQQKNSFSRNPLEILTTMKSDPEILKEALPEEKQHYSELGQRRGNYFDVDQHSRGLKAHNRSNVIRKKNPKTSKGTERVDFHLDSESDDFPSQYMQCIQNAPKRKSYQSFGNSSQYNQRQKVSREDLEAESFDKSTKRCPTFGPKSKEARNNDQRGQETKGNFQKQEFSKMEKKDVDYEVIGGKGDDMQRDLLLEMFNKRVKEVKSINATERNARLKKNPSNTSKKKPGNPSPFNTNESSNPSENQPHLPSKYNQHKQKSDEYYLTSKKTSYENYTEKKSNENHLQPSPHETPIDHPPKYQQNYQKNVPLSPSNDPDREPKKGVLYRRDPSPSSAIKQLNLNKRKSHSAQLASLNTKMGEMLEPSRDIVQLMQLDSRGKVQLNPEALEYISKLEDDLKVVSVIGPYRSGKSFLLNRLNGQQRGFHVGNSTNPCTQGVWLWGINRGDIF